MGKQNLSGVEKEEQRSVKTANMQGLDEANV